MNRLILPLVVALVSCHALAAQEGDQRAADQAAIRSAVESYVEAFHRGDAAAVAAHWTEDGEFFPPTGQTLQGRQAIQKEFEAFFAESKKARLKVSIKSIRFEKPDMAIEEGVARVARPDEPPSETSYVATHVKREGVWKMQSVREAAPPAGPPSHHEQLKELEWMIGEWVDSDENATIETVCQWTKNQNFITRSFSVSIQDRIELEGTQVIGWDPGAKRIRSWLFDSDGCFGEGVWTRKGDRWIVRAFRVLAGGERASSVNIITRVDDNTFTWQSTGREVDGGLLPNIEAVTAVRKQTNQ